MKALENAFQFFKPRGICNSSSFVGGSSSSVSGASSSGISGGSSALTQHILSSVPLAGEDIALGIGSPSLATPQVSAPIAAPTAVSSLGTTSTTTWIIVIVLIVVGIFAFKKL
jgi:hypothetical protein